MAEQKSVEPVKQGAPKVEVETKTYDGPRHQYLISYRYVGKTCAMNGDSQFDLPVVLNVPLLEDIRKTIVKIVEERMGVNNNDGNVTILGIWKFEKE